MKPSLNLLAALALVAGALPAMAEKGSEKNDNQFAEMDPKVMLCSAFEQQTPPDQSSIGMQLKAEMSGNATIAAMSDMELTAEIQKRCGAYPSSTVWDVFTN